MPGLQAAQRRILLVGDSHSAGIFGKEFYKRAKAESHSVQVVGVASSNLMWFFNARKGRSGSFLAYFNGETEKFFKTPKEVTTPLLAPIVEEMRPDILVIAHGSNYFVKQRDGSYRVNQKALIKHFSLLKELLSEDMACYWVSPPSMRRFEKNEKGMLQFLQLHSPCRVLDSLAFTKYPRSGGDGVHYQGRFRNELGLGIASSWANNIFNLIEIDLRLKGDW
jgi:hypothetical protein